MSNLKYTDKVFTVLKFNGHIKRNTMESILFWGMVDLLLTAEYVHQEVPSIFFKKNHLCCYWKE